MTGWEESCLSACLSVFQVEAGGGTGREVEAASLVRISKFYSWATLRHTPNTDTSPGFRPMGRHLRFHQLHGDMRTQGHKCAGHSATHGAGIHSPTHTIIPANHSPMCPHNRLCSGDRKPARGLGSAAAQPSAWGARASPLGLFQVGASHVRPNVSFPNRRNPAPSQQGERAGCGAGWVGAWARARGQGVCAGETGM